MVPICRFGGNSGHVWDTRKEKIGQCKIDVDAYFWRSWEYFFRFTELSAASRYSAHLSEVWHKDGSAENGCDTQRRLRVERQGVT